MLVFHKMQHKINEKGRTKASTLLKKKDRLDKYQLPLERLETYNTWNFTVTQWVPNIFRMRHLQKKVQGPLQENIYKRAHDCT